MRTWVLLDLCCEGTRIDSTPAQPCRYQAHILVVSRKRKQDGDGGGRLGCGVGTYAKQAGREGKAENQFAEVCGAKRPQSSAHSHITH
jgi:hypothetical protein